LGSVMELKGGGRRHSEGGRCTQTLGKGNRRWKSLCASRVMIGSSSVHREQSEGRRRDILLEISTYVGESLKTFFIIWTGKEGEKQGFRERRLIGPCKASKSGHPN